MKRLSTITFLFFHLIFCVQAQEQLKGFQNYAINEKGDTIRGFIEEIGESRITVAALENNEYKVRRLSVKTVVEYHLNDTIYRRVSINLKDNQAEALKLSTNMTSGVFLKLLIDGPAALYERNIKRIKLMDPDTNSDAKGFLHKIPEKQLYLHFDKEKNALLINESNFYEVAMLALGKKKRVKDRLNSGYYTFKTMEQMLLDYNYLVENNIE